MARRVGAVDEPAQRRLNDLPVPRLGGIALFLGILVPSLALLDVTREVRGLLGAATATMVGAVDDFRGLTWWQKLAGQVAAAGVPTAFGIYIDRFTFPFVTDPYIELPAWIGIPATVVWIVALMNMVNFLDGMDGLAAGVCGIAGATFAIIALSLDKPTSAVFSAIVAGACFGFLRHNFYPARIFMGDSGALLLGYALATIAIQGLLKTAATVALFFPLFMLAIPIVDTTFVLARRLKHGEKLYGADQAHLHFRFLRRGFSQRRAALTMYAWCLTLAGRGARHALRPVPRGRRVASLADAARARDRAGRVRVLGVRRLRARARQARRASRPPRRRAGAANRLTDLGDERGGDRHPDRARAGGDRARVERAAAAGLRCDPYRGHDLARLRVEPQDDALARVVPPERATAVDDRSETAGHGGDRSGRAERVRVDAEEAAAVVDRVDPDRSAAGRRDSTATSRRSDASAEGHDSRDS